MCVTTQQAKDHATAHTIRPSLEFVKTKPGTSIVSSVFLMLLSDRVLVYGDCAVNTDPDAEQLADIAISSADTAAMFGIEPRIAMLSYSTGASGTGASVRGVSRFRAKSNAAGAGRDVGDGVDTGAGAGFQPAEGWGSCWSSCSGAPVSCCAGLSEKLGSLRSVA